MRVWKQGLPLLAGLWLFASVALAAAQDGPPAVLELTPATDSIAAGEELLVVLEIANADRLFAADIELSFDPAVAEVVDADPDQDGLQVALGDFLSPDFVVYNTADNGTGRVRVALTQIAPNEPVSGQGRLFEVTFRGLAGGNPDVAVAAAILGRADGSSQPILVPAQGRATPPQPGLTVTATAATTQQPDASPTAGATGQAEATTSTTNTNTTPTADAGVPPEADGTGGGGSAARWLLAGAGVLAVAVGGLLITRRKRRTTGGQG